MRIACPACNAAYDVPPDRVRPGRGVKCARCGGTWVPVDLVDAEPPIQPVAERPPAPVEAIVVPDPAPAMAAVVPVDGFDEPPPMQPAPEPAEPVVVVGPADDGGKERGMVVLAWLVSFAVLGALGWAAIHYRAQIVAAWPASERAYQLIR